MRSRQSRMALPMSMLLLALASAPALAQSSSPAPSGDGGAAPSVPAGPSVTVEGYEYRYEGLPTSVPVGSGLALVNEGAEVHELAVFRRNEGTTESWEELLALPEDEALTKVTPVDASFAAPGQSADHPVLVAQEGDYIAVCFIPQGMTSIPTDGGASPGASGAVDPSEAPASIPAFGPPHFVLGMWQSFAVTAAGSTPGPLPTEAPAASAPAASPGASTAA
jgi:hypothetical protein